MKFSKRSLALFISLIMVTSLFSGCGVGKKDTAKEPNKDNSSEHYEISISDYNNSNWGKDKMGEYIEKKFNVTLVPKSYSQTDWKDKVKLWASAQELPDMFRTMGAYEADTFNKFIKNGVVRDIPVSFIEKNPNLKKYLAWNPVYKEFFNDNKMYSIPHIYWDKQEEDWKGGVTWGRKDWREKLGLKTPVTIEEWDTLLNAFANSDPDGNSKKDTYGLSWYKGELPPFMFSARGAYIEEWVEEDGKWIQGSYSKEANETVKYYKDLLKRGIFDPEYVVMKEVGQVLDKFINNKAGVILYGTMPNEVKDVFEKFEATHPGKKAEDCLEILKYPIGVDGKVHNSAAFNWFSDIEISSKVDDGKLQRILAILDWTVSEEGDRLLRSGFEGEDYKVENGKIVNLIPKDSDGKTMLITDKYPTANIGNYFCQKSTKSFDEATFDKRYQDFSLAAKELFKGTGLEKTINLKAKFLYTPKKAKFNPLNAFRDASNKVILSNGNVDEELQKFWNNFNIEYDLDGTFKEVTEAMKK